MPCRATQDGWVVESSDKTWSPGEGNGKWLQYSCLQNPMNSMKKWWTGKPGLLQSMGSQRARHNWAAELKDGRSHNETGVGECVWYNQISYLPGGQPTNWKVIISQNFSHRSESSEAQLRVPNLGVWHMDKSLEHLAWRPVGLQCRNSIIIGETEIPLLEYTYTGTWGKAVTP